VERFTNRAKLSTKTECGCGDPKTRKVRGGHSLGSQSPTGAAILALIPRRGQKKPGSLPDPAVGLDGLAGQPSDAGHAKKQSRSAISPNGSLSAKVGVSKNRDNCRIFEPWTPARDAFTTAFFGQREPHLTELWAMSENAA